MTRQQKTPRQRANEALGVAQRRVDRLTKEHDRRKAELEALTVELFEAQHRLDYAKQDPALSNTQPRPTSKETPA